MRIFLAEEEKDPSTRKILALGTAELDYRDPSPPRDQELLVVCNSTWLFNRILKQQQNILVVDSKGGCGRVIEFIQDAIAKCW